MQQCPEFFSPVNNGCVYDCSQHPLFRLTTTNNQPKCEYQFDNDRTVELVPQNMVYVTGTPNPPSFEELQSVYPSQYTRYKAEIDRADTAIQGLLSQMSHGDRVQDAFRALQTAEASRARNPIAYQQARNAYYRLTEGDSWLQEEEKRIRDAEVGPDLQRYRNEYDSATLQKTEQQKTLDIVEAVKDRVLSLKDDFQYSTSLFKSQLDRVKSQINIERRGRAGGTTINEDTTVFYGWFTIVLNLVLVVLGVYMALTLWKVVRTRWLRPLPTYTRPAPMA